jgi:hypothetical protein
MHFIWDVTQCLVILQQTPHQIFTKLHMSLSLANNRMMKEKNWWNHINRVESAFRAWWLVL